MHTNESSRRRRIPVMLAGVIMTSFCPSVALAAGGVVVILRPTNSCVEIQEALDGLPAGGEPCWTPGNTKSPGHCCCGTMMRPCAARDLRPCCAWPTMPTAPWSFWRRR